MPRPKPNKASPCFSSYGLPLGEETRSKLLNLLGYRLADLQAESVRHHVDEIILAIEGALGIYADGAQHLDDIPRPVHYVNAFRSIRSQAGKLSETLFGLGQYFSDELSRRGVDSNDIAAKLLALDEVSKAVIKTFEGKPSKGASKKTALTEVIRRLRGIFRDSYRGPVTGRSTKGFIKFPSVRERREFDFIRLLVEEIGFIRTPKALHRLVFKDPRCALTEERKTPV